MSDFLINTLTHPAFTAAIGFLAGHFLAIGRDRRKEFNEAAEVLFRELTNDAPAPNFIAFRRRLPWYRHRGFDKCEAEYKEARSDKNKTELDFFGRKNCRDTSLLKATKDKLLKYTELT